MAEATPEAIPEAKRITLHVWALPLLAQDVPGARRAEALAASNGFDKLRRFRLPTHVEAPIREIWPLVEKRFTDNYLDDDAKKYFVIKKLQDGYDCDLNMDDTVGAIFEDEPLDRRIIKIVPSFVDRDFSLPATTNLRPYHSSKRLRETSRGREDKRRRLDAQREELLEPGCDQPPPSAESDTQAESHIARSRQEESSELGMPPARALHARENESVKSVPTPHWNGTSSTRARGPGRPRKGVNSSGRGRPRKSVNPTGNNPITPARRPGRPRKSVSENAQTPDAAASSPEAGRRPARYLSRSPTPEQSSSDEDSEASRSRSPSRAASLKPEKSEHEESGSETSSDSSGSETSSESSDDAEPTVQNSVDPSITRPSASQPTSRSSGGPLRSSLADRSPTTFRRFPTLAEQLAQMRQSNMPTLEKEPTEPKPTEQKPALGKPKRNIFAPDYSASEDESSSNTSDSDEEDAGKA